MEILEEERKVQRLFKELVAKNFPNIGRHTSINAHLYEVQKAPQAGRTERGFQWGTLQSNSHNSKTEIVKSVKETSSTANQVPIRLSMNFSTETLQVMRGGISSKSLKE